MSKRLLNLCLTALLSVVSTAAWALSEVNGVYQIGTAEDLHAFAELVNGGQANASAVLTADIDKGIDDIMIGCDSYHYQGTFDGQGHTITINMFSEVEGAALFRNLGPDALIKDVKVQGTITTNQKFASGIAAWGGGSIIGCYVDVTVNSSFAGDATHGGFIAVADQGALIENSLAKFVIKGATTQNCGGIVGWCNNRVNIVNCLVISDGSTLDLSNRGSNNLARNAGQLQVVNLEEYCDTTYYTKRPGGATYNNYVTNQWGDNVNTTVVAYDGLADGRICYQLNNDQSHIAWVQQIGTDPFPVPAAFGTGQVYASGPTDCDGKSEAELTFSNEGTAQATAHVYDKFGICQTCGCFNFHGLERDFTDGYYILRTAADIDLAEGLNRLQNGAQFSLKMANDITYTAEPGRFIFNNGNWFDGNFNGQGHELTIEMSDMTEGSASLFPCFAGNYFENVIMHGTISTSGQYAGSISGHTYRDRVKVRNVFSDITINASRGGDNTTGGLFGVVESKTIVDNTIYAGDINGTGSSECLAGFAGWSGGQTYYTNCAFLGTLNNAVGDSKTLSRNPGNIACDNVYFANSNGYDDEAKATLIEDFDDIASGALAYALNSNKSGLDRFYQKIDEDLMPMPIKKEGALVYATAEGYRCDGQPEGSVIYTNTDPGEIVLPPHEYVDGFCENCGGLQENFLTPVDGWYEISNGAELVWWTNYAAKHLDASARLTADIDMDGYCERWANVGTEGAPFYGNFDGQYHTISNLIVDKPSSNGVGLIAVMNSLPVAKYNGISDDDARKAEGVYIKNVVLDETCSLTGRGYVGLVGMTAPWAGHVNIKGVMMCGDVRADGGPNASGVFGCVMGSSCHVTIDNCGMVGNVYGTKENGSFSGWLGSYAEVTNCFAVGSVEGIQDDAHYFARYSSATFTNCYAKYGTQVPTVTDEDFQSGALAWRANGYQFRTSYWYQTIGEDNYPFPNPAHGTVLYAAGQYFSMANEDEMQEVAAAIQTYEEEAVEETIATQAVLDEYATLLESLGESADILEFADAIDSINAKKDVIAENAKVYQTYIDKCEETKKFLESEQTFEGELRTALEYYLAETDEPTEENPLGTYGYIVENHLATAEEIQAEIDRVTEWLQNAIAGGYMAGSDVSKMIPNGDFSFGYNEKWTDGWATGIGDVKNQETGSTHYGVEAWNVTGDMYQTIEGMKPGYYLVGVNAAYRPSNNRYSTNYAAGIYANGIFNYFPTVFEDYVEANDTIDQVNCNLHGGGALDLPIYDDFMSTSQEQADATGATLLGYAVHGPYGMAIAAMVGRHQVYTIANVGEDGKLTIGIKNPGTKYDNDWTGWSALKVTYCGDDADLSSEALDKVLENMTARATSISEYMFSEELAAAAPNFPNALKEELEQIVAQVEAAETVEAKVALAEKFSDLFQRIYEGKQAYIALFNTASTMQSLEGGNLPLVEKDAETGEWIETGESVFSEAETEVLFYASNDMLEAYLSGDYSTEQALNPEVMSSEAIIQILPEKDEEGFYLLGNPKQLVAFRAIADADYTVKAKLVNDINMSGIAMQPINRWDYSYRGTFDGQGYAISDLYINFTDPDQGRCGLFNTLDQATVKNLKVSGDYYSSGKFMGGIVGQAYAATIQNCIVDVNLYSTISGDGTHGGIIGNNAGDNSVVENCIIYTQILGDAVSNCGGVVGWSGSKSTVRNNLIFAGGTKNSVFDEAISRNGGNCTMSNNFLLTRPAGSQGTVVTKEELASGEVTYLLNNSQSEECNWFQTIGVDSIPCLFDGAIVYFYANQYVNEKPNPQLNAFAYNVKARIAGDNVVVGFNLNAEAEAAEVRFFNGETLVYSKSVSDLAAGAQQVTVPAAELGSGDITALNYEVAVTGKGSLDIRKMGESYKFSSPYGLAINNDPASAGFGQILVTESRSKEKLEGMFSDGNPGALFAFDAAFEPVGSYYGGLDIPNEEPLIIFGNYQFDLKDLRFTEDGRLFVARASGTSNSSVWEINPDDLDEPWKPVFKGGELDEATGITYVGEEEQNRMAVAFAFEGAGEDLKMYVLGGQRSNGEANTTDYNCAYYDLGTATEWTTAPSGYVAALDGVYTISPSHVGIHEDGQGGLWYVQYRSTPTAEEPSIKHFDAEGNEDYSNITTSTNSGKMTVTQDGKYIAIPMGSNKVVIYETNYVPMANGKIFLNPIYNISTTENQVTGLAFDYAGNLYVASSGTKTLSRYVIPSWNDNKTVTPGFGYEKGIIGDLNGDGEVNIADAVIVLNAMATANPDMACDLNGDGGVDISDFVTVLNLMAQ